LPPDRFIALSRFNPTGAIEIQQVAPYGLMVDGASVNQLLSRRDGVALTAGDNTNNEIVLADSGGEGLGDRSSTSGPFHHPGFLLLRATPAWPPVSRINPRFAPLEPRFSKRMWLVVGRG